MGDNQLIHIKMSLEMYRALKRQMRKQNKTLSAIIREAVAEWLERRGDWADPTAVQWGGFRDGEVEDPNLAAYAVR